MYIILHDPDFRCKFDEDDFNPDHLTYNARIYYDKADKVYYSDKPNEVDVNQMVRLK